MKELIPSKEESQPRSVEIFEELKKLGAFLRGNEDDFLEVFEMLDQEFKEASPEKRKDILTQRYFSTFAGDYQAKADSHSVFFGREALKDKGVEVGNVNKTRNKEDLKSNNDLVEIMQYGSSRVYDVQPGGWVIAEMGDQDIIGSSLFSCCTSVVARSGDTVGFAHIRMGDNASTKFMVDFFSKQLRGSQIHLFQAESSTGDSEKDGHINDWARKMNDELKQSGIDVKVHSYPYIVEGMKNNPHGQHSASLVVSRDMVRSIGVKEEFKKKGSETQTILHPIEGAVKDLD